MSEDKSNSERYLKISDLQKEAEERYPLWKFFVEEHGLHLLESQLDDIIHVVKKHLANVERRAGREKSELSEGLASKAAGVANAVKSCAVDAHMGTKDPEQAKAEAVEVIKKYGKEIAEEQRQNVRNKVRDYITARANKKPRSGEDAMYQKMLRGMKGDLCRKCIYAPEPPL